MTMKGLTKQQKAQYQDEGFTTVEGLLADDECDRFVEHMVALLDGGTWLEGFSPRAAGERGRTHNQHQCYLPACICAWLAFMDVDERNGTIYVQLGSHKRRLLMRADLEEGGEFSGQDYNVAVDSLAQGHDLPEVPVRQDSAAWLRPSRIGQPLHPLQL